MDWINMVQPNKIPGLALWLDASDPSTINGGASSSNGVFVNTWSDKAGGYTLTSPQIGGNFVVGAGPTYAVGAVNGKNAIRFDYFSAAQVNNTSYRRLGVINCAPVGLATHTTYLVYFPYDVRQQTSASLGTVVSRESVITVYSGSRVTSLLPKGVYADKQWDW
jgi:hypothetical protein